MNVNMLMVYMPMTVGMFMSVLLVSIMCGQNNYRMKGSDAE